MRRIRLTDSRVKALKPRKSIHSVRDAELRGFGVSVLPTGRKSFFVHSQHDGRRVWKTVGDAARVDVDSARKAAVAILAANRTGKDLPVPADKTVFEAVAEEVFRNYGRNWKPRTLKVNRGYLRNQILPWFAGRQVADITGRDVQQWVASLHMTPAAADRSAPILSVIMRQAEVYGYRPEGSNPCVGIRRYRRKGRERFLSARELHRLSGILAGYRRSRPFHVAFVQLLLLTGCRSDEIRTLKWPDYRDGHLFLRDGKTGPRTVWLSSPARAVLDALPRTSQWVYPSPRKKGPLCEVSFHNFWCRVRDEAEIQDARLHDLRHTYASIAVMQGETVLTTGRLLGHNAPETTLKYAHLSDDSVRRATDALAGILGDR